MTKFALNYKNRSEENPSGGEDQDVQRPVPLAQNGIAAKYPGGGYKLSADHSELDGATQAPTFRRESESRSKWNTMPEG